MRPSEEGLVLPSVLVLSGALLLLVLALLAPAGTLHVVAFAAVAQMVALDRKVPRRLYSYLLAGSGILFLSAVLSFPSHGAVLFRVPLTRGYFYVLRGGELFSATVAGLRFLLVTVSAVGASFGAHPGPFLLVRARWLRGFLLLLNTAMATSRNAALLMQNSVLAARALGLKGARAARAALLNALALTVDRSVDAVAMVELRTEPSVSALVLLPLLMPVVALLLLSVESVTLTGAVWWAAMGTLSVAVGSRGRWS